MVYCLVKRSYLQITLASNRARKAHVAEQLSSKLGAFVVENALYVSLIEPISKQQISQHDLHQSVVTDLNTACTIQKLSLQSCGKIQDCWQWGPKKHAKSGNTET